MWTDIGRSGRESDAITVKTGTARLGFISGNAGISPCLEIPREHGLRPPQNAQEPRILLVIGKGRALKSAFLLPYRRYQLGKCLTKCGNASKYRYMDSRDGTKGGRGNPHPFEEADAYPGHSSGRIAIFGRRRQ